jgi:hypothetical protein
MWGWLEDIVGWFQKQWNATLAFLKENWVAVVAGIVLGLVAIILAPIAIAALVGAGVGALLAAVIVGAATGIIIAGTSAYAGIVHGHFKAGQGGLGAFGVSGSEAMQIGKAALIGGVMGGGLALVGPIVGGVIGVGGGQIIGVAEHGWDWSHWDDNLLFNVLQTAAFVGAGKYAQSRGGVRVTNANEPVPVTETRPVPVTETQPAPRANPSEPVSAPKGSTPEPVAPAKASTSEPVAAPKGEVVEPVAVPSKGEPAAPAKSEPVAAKPVEAPEVAPTAKPEAPEVAPTPKKPGLVKRAANAVKNEILEIPKNLKQVTTEVRELPQGVKNANATKANVKAMQENYPRELQDPALAEQYKNVQETIDPKVKQQKAEVLEQQLQQTKQARESVENLQSEHGKQIEGNPQLKAEFEQVQRETNPKLKQEQAQILSERIAEFNKPVSVEGKVTGAYDWGTPGPLPDGMAVTFKGARYREVILENDTVLYRAGENDKPLGQYFSKERPVGEVQTRIDKAVLPEWPGGGKSPIESGYGIKIPKGTKVYVGEVAGQGGMYMGGSEQIVVQQPWKIPGVQPVEAYPMTPAPYNKPKAAMVTPEVVEPVSTTATTPKATTPEVEPVPAKTTVNDEVTTRYAKELADPKNKPLLEKLEAAQKIEDSAIRDQKIRELEQSLDQVRKQNRQDRIDELSYDQDRGGVDDQSRHEAEVLVNLGEKGTLKEPVRRPVKGERGDGIDADGQSWDIKRPRSRDSLIKDIEDTAIAKGKKAPTFPADKPIKGEFEVEVTIKEYKKQLEDGKKLIIATDKLNPIDLKALREKAAQEGIDNGIIWYP